MDCLAYVKALLPSASLSQCFRVVTALEQAVPDQQMVRVPWNSMTNAYEIARQYEKETSAGHEPTGRRWKEFEQKVKAHFDTIITPLPDEWGNGSTSNYFHGCSPYVLPGVRHHGLQPSVEGAGTQRGDTPVLNTTKSRNTSLFTYARPA